jgi:hypothetical protein
MTTRPWMTYIPTEDAGFLVWCLAAGALGATTIELLRAAWDARPMPSTRRTLKAAS